MARRNIHDDEDEFDDDVEAVDEDEELAREGYFVEDEDGMKDSKKSLDFEEEEVYFLDHSEQGVRGGRLFDDYSDEEGSADAEEDS